MTSSNDESGSAGTWAAVERLLEALAGDPGLIDEAVHDVRATVPGIARLTSEDVARHTRALFAAAVRAIAARRRPSRAELDFIEDLAVTRAGQGVPIQDVLAAIHVAQRHIWVRARRHAPSYDVDPELLLDARELFEDWAEQVRGRLIVAHRRTELSRARWRRDRQGMLLRRLLEGGSAAVLAAAEAGLPGDAVWVVYGQADDGDTHGEPSLRTGDADLFDILDGALVGVLGARPGEASATFGLAGPSPAEELHNTSALARRAHLAAVALQRTGLVPVAEVAAVMALQAAPDVGELLQAERLAELDRSDEYAVEVATTVRRYLELDRRVEATAAALYVHPNTVRHRLQRFRDLTGTSLDGTFSGVEAWWAVTQWLDARRDGT